MKKIFETHPNLDVLYRTADGIVFLTENNAENHAKSLEDKRVKKVYRTDVVKRKGTGFKEEKDSKPKNDELKEEEADTGSDKSVKSKSSENNEKKTDALKERKKEKKGGK